jgi:hypothetical protein
MGSEKQKGPCNFTRCNSSKQVGNNFFLYNKIELKYNGAPVILGSAGYYPIAAVATSTGYDVAWSWPGYGYTVWSTDANGNYTGNLIGWVAGNTQTIRNYEIIFAADLNGDGIIGTPKTKVCSLAPYYNFGYSFGSQPNYKVVQGLSSPNACIQYCQSQNSVACAYYSAAHYSAAPTACAAILSTSGLGYGYDAGSADLYFGFCN